jgi:aryl-alcohol dehydrogenase-like predicted oxidoreductase
MQYRELGNSGIQVSMVGFGCWAIIGGFTWGDQRVSDSVDAMRIAFDEGVTFFDTAEAYGNGTSEQLLAKALEHVRTKIVIASKVSPEHFSRAELFSACERSLTNLKTDYIDLYQLHWPNAAIPIMETMSALEELKAQGKIRAFGISNFGPQDMSEAMLANTHIVSNQLAYNILFRPVEYELAPLCHDKNISILCYCPLAQGLLTGKFKTIADVPPERARTRLFSCTRPHAKHSESGVEPEVFEALEGIKKIADSLRITPEQLSLSWLLAKQGVTLVIAGGRYPAQVKTNVAAADVSLTPEIVSELDACTEPVKVLLGRNLDMWLSQSRIR